MTYKSTKYSSLNTTCPFLGIELFSGGNSSIVEPCVCHRKVVDSRFDSQQAMRRRVVWNVLSIISIGAELSLPVAVAQPHERLANRTEKQCPALVWLYAECHDV